MESYNDQVLVCWFLLLMHLLHLEDVNSLVITVHWLDSTF